MSANSARIAAHLNRRSRWRLPEIIFWLVVVALIFAFPSRDALINEILVLACSALSSSDLDPRPRRGVVSLGHAAFLGCRLAYSAVKILSWPTPAINDP